MMSEEERNWCYEESAFGTSCSALSNARKQIKNLEEHRDRCCSIAAQAEADFERWRDMKNEQLTEMEKIACYFFMLWQTNGHMNVSPDYHMKMYNEAKKRFLEE